MAVKNNGKSSSAFYEPPQRKTSAEIINEARLAIRESQMAENGFSPPTIKPVQTKRPFTPRDKERLLFGTKSKPNRPPSSFSLRYLQHETDKPPIKTPDFEKIKRSNSLSEINDKIFNIAVKETKIKLPSLQKRKIFNTTSLDNLPEEGELTESRNAFSSPQERTNFDDPVFGYSSKKQRNLSRCLLLGPQNLEKIFHNKEIIENSQTLFLNSVAASRKNDPDSNKDDRVRSHEDVINDLNALDLNRDDLVVKHLNELYFCMEKEGLIGSKISSKLRITILKCLYKFVESKNEVMLIGIAKIILSLKVTGNNLSGVCKLIFKVAKNDNNDHLFFQNDLLELFLDALGRSSPLDDSEACIYGYGTIKFLAMNPKLLEKLLQLGILQLMVLHIKIINTTKKEKNVSEQTNHALFQLTGALRNLVSEDLIYDNFIACGTITQLCETLELFMADPDITGNISRTLSTISTNECCCDAINDVKTVYKLFVALFKKYSNNEEIIVRLAYTLGNIVAKIDNTRVKFYNEESSIETLIDLWKIYLERTLETCSEGDSANNPEDVMIKIIRVVANVVINPEIGKELNEKYGNNLIDEILKVLISNPFKKNDELVLSILSTLNNLSYYYTNDVMDVFHMKQVDIVEAITEFMSSQNKECITETMRILGNLSRSKITRQYITESKVFENLMFLLDKSDLTLLKTTVGVFVNLMSDNKARSSFRKHGGVDKLIKILKINCEGDWLLGNLVCQVLWNYCINTIDLHELLTDKEIEQLLVLLADYLDEERLFGIEDHDHVEDSEIYVTQEYLIWEEFANVATNLLEKIEYFLDTFDQINLDDESCDNGRISKENNCTNNNLSFAAW